MGLSAIELFLNSQIISTSNIMTDRLKLVFRILFSTVLASVAFSAINAADSKKQPNKNSREFYEIRVYSFDTAKQQQRVADYWADAAIPALNRLGCDRIGLFQETEKQDGKDLEQIVVLIPYTNLSQLNTLEMKLGKDRKYRKAAASYLDASKQNPAYKRIESHLLRALKVKPTLSVPNTKRSRIFEMREYEGHGETASETKIAMFDEVEANIFAESGLDAVFYGKTIIGKNRPSLMYMISFEDEEEREADWNSFRSNPRWDVAKRNPKYSAGGVSGRTVFMLKPLSGSQL